MDLKNYNIEESSWMTLNDPAGNPTDARIEIVSRDSDTFKKAQRRISEARRKKAKGLRAAEEETMTYEMIAKCTVSWENIQNEGKEYKCNYENALFLYKTTDWITEQVLAFIADRENFLSI